MGLGGVAIAVSPYVIHPKTAVLGRAGGANLDLLKTNIDNVILVSVGYDATLHCEERRVAA